MAIKFSELTPRVSTLADLDLFAVSDYSEGSSVAIAFGDLKGIIIDQDTFTNNAGLIVNALNEYTSPVTGYNEVQATTLQSRDPVTGFITPVDLTYILDYRNATNKPNIPTDLHDINNFSEGDNGGYVRFRTTEIGSGGELVFQPIVSGVVTQGLVISTDYISEGANLYYTQERVEDFMDANFGEYYNSFAATFDEGNVKDSYFDTVGEFQLQQVTGNPGNESDVIRIYRIGFIPGSIKTRQQLNRFLGYRAGQNIRIFGADPIDRGLPSGAPTTAFDIQVTGFRDEALGSSDLHLGLSYKICEWDLETGQVTIGSPAKSVYIGVPEYVQNQAIIDNYTPQQLLDDFGIENFIDLKFTNIPEGGNKGLLVYRQILGGFVANTTVYGVQGQHELIAVLGPKELTTSVWKDYYTDDILNYNNKNQSTNTYLAENMVHFKPNKEPDSAQYGWVDRTIREVRPQNPNNISISDYIDIYLDDVVSGSGDGCWISHDDTTKIQTAIDFNSVNGRKAIQLNPKNYIVREISVPDNFGISGFAYNTSMTRMPWSSYSNIPSNKIIKTSNASGAKNISLVAFDIDGNACNQYLLEDATVPARNYIIDLGTESDSILIDKVRVKNMIGGGVYASLGTTFKLFASEIFDSGLSDRYLYSPLKLDDGINTSIVSNRFQNFTENIDCSATRYGVIQGNIINACGSGLLVYGSSFLIAEPNILVGPAGEFLPNPDAYNSEYDSINVDLTSSAANGFGPYDSDNFKYQQNGENYDLTGSVLTYRTFALSKLPTGLEDIWIPEIQNSEDYIRLEYNTSSDNPLSEGGFGFHMEADTVERIKYNGGRYKQVLITNGGTGYANGDTIILEGNDLGGANGHNDIVLTVAYALNGVIQEVDVDASPSVIQSKTYTGITGSTDGGGQNATFTVTTTGGVYTYAFMSDPANQIPTGDGQYVAGNPYHVGLGWSASIDQYVEIADITNTATNRGTWSAPYTFPEGSSERYSDYTITVDNYKYLTIGRKVTPQEIGDYAHQGFSAGSTYIWLGVPHLPESYGEIIAIEPQGNFREVKIRWKWANYQGTATQGYGGRLKGQNTFLIATGRIK